MNRNTSSLRMLLPMLAFLVCMVLSMITAVRETASGTTNDRLQLYMALTALFYALAASAPEAESFPSIRRMLPVSAILGSAMLLVWLRGRFFPAMSPQADATVMLCALGLSIGLLLSRRRKG